MKKKHPLIPLLPEVMDFHLDDDNRLEAPIQKDILDFLKTVPYSNFAKIAQGPWSKNGVVDIVGCYYGRSVVIEVKREIKRPTSLQTMYLNDNIKAQGFSAVARSVADVEGVLDVVKEQVHVQEFLVNLSRT